MKRVVCLGSYQGSDEIAWLLADALQRSARLRNVIEVMCCASPANLPGLCSGVDALAVIDATPDLPVACVQRLSETELAERTSCSSHGVDLLTALGVARALGELPPRVVIIGVGVGSGTGERFSEQSLRQYLPAVLAELEKL